MRSTTSSDSVEVAPGESGMISVSVTNTSAVIDAFRVQVFGLDPAWVTVTPERLSLFPGQTENVDISVVLPPEYPASNRTISVNVSSADDPGAFSLSQVELEVPAAQRGVGTNRPGDDHRRTQRAVRSRHLERRQRLRRWPRHTPATPRIWPPSSSPHPWSRCRQATNRSSRSPRPVDARGSVNLASGPSRSGLRPRAASRRSARSSNARESVAG